jgi:hypothetical protein
MVNLGGKNIAMKTFKTTKSSAKIQCEADFQQTCAGIVEEISGDPFGLNI